MANMLANAETVTKMAGTFDGKQPRYINTYLKVFDDALTMTPINDYDDIRRVMMCCFRDKARDQLANIGAQVQTKDDLYKALREFYGDRTSPQLRHQGLLAYHQGAKSMQQYVDGFLEQIAIAQVANQDDEGIRLFLTAIFIKGITADAIRTHINTTAQLDSLPDLFSLALKLDASNRTAARVYKSNPPPRRQGGGERLNKNSHFKKKSDNQPGHSSDISKIKCYNCNKLGHISKDCRSPRRENHQARQTASIKKDDPPPGNGEGRA